MAEEWTKSALGVTERPQVAVRRRMACIDAVPSQFSQLRGIDQTRCIKQLQLVASLRRSIAARMP